MRLLDRYLFRELFTPLAFCLGGLVVLGTCFSLFGELAELQERKLQGSGLVYQLMNVFGALGVVLSLLFGVAINWPALLMEVAWIAIGIFGIVHSARARREARELGSKFTP